MKNPFKDKNGKVVIVQMPNWQLYSAVVVRFAQFLAPEGRLESGLRLGFQLLLVIWAYEEIMRGVNYFRRALGVLILVFTFINLFSSVT